MPGRIKPQPGHILANCIHVLGFFLGRIGIVKAQIADALRALHLIIPGQAEIQEDAFCVTKVQKPIGFGRETGHHLVAVGLLGAVLVDSGTDKVTGNRGFGHGALRDGLNNKELLYEI